MTKGKESTAKKVSTKDMSDNVVVPFRDLSKAKVSIDDNSGPALASDRSVDETWDVAYVIPREENKMCQLKYDACKGVAVATWVSSLDPEGNEPWNYCESCAKDDFPSNDNVQNLTEASPRGNQEETTKIQEPSNDIIVGNHKNGDAKETSNANTGAETISRKQVEKTDTSIDAPIASINEETITQVKLAPNTSNDSKSDTTPKKGNRSTSDTKHETSDPLGFINKTNKGETSMNEVISVTPDSPNIFDATDTSNNTNKRTDHPDAITNMQGNSGIAKEEEVWNLKRILPLSSITRECPVKCSSSECMLAACSIWTLNLEPETNWYSCIDCQLQDFEGWPDPNEAPLPIRLMTEEHKRAIADKCSIQTSPQMPKLPSYDESTSSPHNKMTDSGTASNTITPPPNSISNTQQVRNKGVGSTVTPCPAVITSKPPQPSSKLIAVHRKWQADAIAMGGPDARIIVDKNETKKIIFDLLHDAFRPFNITEIFKGLKAVVPSPVLKSCLDDMALDKFGDGNPFADSDDEDEDSSKKKPSLPSDDTYTGSLLFKGGRNTNTSLYFVDHAKLKNSGNGLEPEDRNNLICDVQKADNDEVTLKAELQRITAMTKQLLSEPTNEKAATSLEEEHTEMADLSEQLEAGRKLKVNEKHKKQTKKRIETMTTYWRKRKRLCMDFLITIEESTDGAISAKKCLKGDGPIECDSDEAVSDGAIAYALKKRVRVASGTAIGRKVKPRVQKKIITTSSQKSSIIAGVASDDSFVAVQLDAKGNARRIYLDNAKETDEEAMRPKKQNKVSFC